MFTAFFEGMKTAQDIDPNIAARLSCIPASISALVRRYDENYDRCQNEGKSAF
jgi:hypothetical protein